MATSTYSLRLLVEALTYCVQRDLKECPAPSRKFFHEGIRKEFLCCKLEKQIAWVRMSNKVALWPKINNSNNEVYACSASCTLQGHQKHGRMLQLTSSSLTQRTNADIQQPLLSIRAFQAFNWNRWKTPVRIYLKDRFESLQHATSVIQHLK